MDETQEKVSLGKAASSLMLQDVPYYANRFFFSLGFLSMTSFFILLFTGTIMVFFGADWWLTNSLGVYLRSVHLWATQAFIFFIFLHLLIVFLTSGYKGKRKLTWVVGVVMLIFVFAEAEFGYILRGDYSSQWRSLQASDFYNGTGLGFKINNLNSVQIYGIHIAFIPFILIALLSFHYFLIKSLGLSKSKADIPTVKANHTLLFVRGFSLALVVAFLAFFFKSPFIAPYTLSDIAKNDPSLFAKTLVLEFSRTSDTATYLDNINPYQYDSRQIYIATPYQKLLSLGESPDSLSRFEAENQANQEKDLEDAGNYFDGGGKLDEKNPNAAISVVSSLVGLAKAGFYEDSLKGLSVPKGTTYATRLLADTGVLEDKAEELKITTPDYGMIKEEGTKIPPGAWWLSPIGVLNHTVLANDENGDRDGAIILGLALFLLLAFPFIPVVNKLPDKLPFGRWIWGKPKV